MLQIKDLKASIGGTEILRGLSLDVNAGEVPAIMRPNGSGKSTLAQVIAGHTDYEVSAGTVTALVSVSDVVEGGRSGFGRSPNAESSAENSSRTNPPSEI